MLPNLLIQAVWLFGIYGCQEIRQRVFDHFVDGASMNMDSLIVDSLLHNKLSLSVRARKVLYAFSIAQIRVHFGSVRTQNRSMGIDYGTPPDPTKSHVDKTIKQRSMTYVRSAREL